MAQKNNKFLGYGVILSILGIIFMFLYSGLQNDQINIIQAYSAWDNNMTMLPMTVGNFVCIVLTFIYGTMFIKFGVKKSLIPVMILSAVGCIGIVAANGLKCNGGEGNYILFFISLFVVRCTCMMLQMAGFQLVASWFIRLRGRIMGIVTLGSPLFSVIGTAGMTTMIEKSFGGDYRPFYVGIAVILVVVAILVAFLIKDTPESVGLYPDGLDHPPVSEAEEEVKLTLKDVLTSAKGWKVIISFGALTFIINACMGSMAARYMMLGGGGPEVWLVAVKYLAIGAILGIPMSFIFGVLDDKIGTVKASIVLGLCELLPILGLALQPEGGSVPLMIIWGFGVACMTGGVPTLHPCIMAFAYGRKEYQSANRIIMAIQLIPSAVAAQIMVMLLGTGNVVGAYGLLLVVLLIGIVALLTMLKMKDANAADRDYGKKEKAA
ncbi:MAG: MFS transporter [Eubacterium sp.]|nr:MFS transporter [Eubacterium sp.]